MPLIFSFDSLLCVIIVLIKVAFSTTENQKVDNKSRKTSQSHESPWSFPTSQNPVPYRSVMLCAFEGYPINSAFKMSDKI